MSLKRRIDSPDGHRSAKCPKLDGLSVDWQACFNDSSNRSSVTKLFDVPADSKAYIVLRVSTVRDFNPGTRLEFKAISTEVVAGQRKYLPIHVHFSDRCLATLRERNVAVNPQDEILLALKYARSEVSQDGLPLLRYPANVVFQFRTCAERRLCGTIVNTADWFEKVEAPVVPSTDDMDIDVDTEQTAQSSRTEPCQSDSPIHTAIHDAQVDIAPPVPKPGSAKQDLVTPHLHTVEHPLARQPSDDGRAQNIPGQPSPPRDSEHTRPASPDQPQTLTKGQRKKLKKLRAKAKKAEMTGPTTPVTISPTESASGSVVQVMPARQVSAVSPAPALPSPPTTPTNQALLVQLGGGNHDETYALVTHREKYTALNTRIKEGTFWSAIGIVESAREVCQTRTGEWQSYMRLLDRSVFGSGGSVAVSSFAKLHRGWAPQPAPGQVVILRGIKRYRSQNIGYGDRLQWAVYDPATRTASHGNLPDDVPRRAPLPNSGHLFSPFHEADEEETAYCALLHEWWQLAQQEKQRQDEQLRASGSVVQIEAPMRAVSSRTWSRRPHIPIADMSLSVNQGYFDCTVEIVYTYGVAKNAHSEGDWGSVYVTDYSRNENMPVYRCTWVPDGLGDRILHIEMSEAARMAASAFLPGDYWHIRNCRIKMNGEEKYEGRQKEAKFQKLSEADAEKEPMLKALLARKRDWQAANNVLDTPTADCCTIGDAELKSFFDTLVEVIRVEGSDLYVTDYTNNPSIQHQRSAADSGCPILKIRTEGTQASIAEGLSSGVLCRLTNLRIVRSEVEQQTFGKLGGSERKRILRVNPALSSGDRALQDLLRRKEEWEKDYRQRLKKEECSTVKMEKSQAEDVLSNRTSTTPRQAKQPASRKLEKGPSSLTFAELRDKPKSSYTVTARATRVLDHRKWEACILRVCTRCNKDVPQINTACPDCHDFDHEFVQIKGAKVSLQLTDMVGGTAEVAIVSEALQGLCKELTKSSDPEGLFKDWLKPMTGDDLKKVKTGNTPWADVYLLKKENGAYCLLDFELRPA